jgi:phage terminase large subunit
MPDLELRGAVAELHRLALDEWPNLPEGSPPVEILMEGPGGTGKTTGLVSLFFSLAVRYPGSRQLWVRETRASMTDSVLATFHDDVLPPGHYLNGRRPTDHTKHYRLNNGSEIVLGGLDRPSRLYSTSFDLVYVNEVFELPSDDPWQRFLRSLRNRRFTDGASAPFHVLIGDTNPEDPGHWANQRFLPDDVDRLL